MDKNKKILTTVLSIVAVAILGVFLIIGGKSFTANYDGKIIIEVVDKDGSVVASKKVKFEEGDTLIKVVSANFDNVSVSGEGEWQMIESIETIENASDWSYYICVFVNDVESQVGLASIQFEDGMKISFKLLDNPYD